MSQPVPRILVVEDDEAHGEALRDALVLDGHAVELASSAEAAMDRLRVRGFDLVVTDLVLGEADGFDLIAAIRDWDPGLSVILITGHGSVEIAVRAMQEGAADYISKPVNLAEFRTRVARELEKRHLEQDNRELRATLDRRFGLEGLVGNADPMRHLFDQVRQVAPTNATCLIMGESGTGKELVARALHQLSERQSRRFVAVNCAAISESLMESELFGHTRGAFTGATQPKEGKFEFADGGTLFLDEVGDMPLNTQAKLLRVLEDRQVTRVGANEPKQVDVRVLAATNQDLLAKVERKEFRQDLYYRLEVVCLRLPALRDRLEDVPLLVEHFLHQAATSHGVDLPSIDRAVIDRLQAHDWPGNVRQLSNTIHSMVVLDGDGTLGLDDLPPDLAGLAPRAESGLATLGSRTLAEVEREMIALHLKKADGNRAKAASSLGMSERTLYRKLKEAGIDEDPGGKG